RHLALSCARPDAGVADTLEEAATMATARGAPSVAGELLELASGLTPPAAGAARWRRRLALGDRLFDCGSTARARTVFEPLVAGAPPGGDRSEALVRLRLGGPGGEGRGGGGPRA